MNAIFRKDSRVKLKPEAYAQLQRQVLARDSWRCQNCGRESYLQVHHLQFRSSLGADILDNLITLCVKCHDKLHDRR
jgi:5-methylcytosine-specific restriction endonuclease McrA